MCWSLKYNQDKLEALLCFLLTLLCRLQTESIKWVREIHIMYYVVQNIDWFFIFNLKEKELIIHSQYVYFPFKTVQVDINIRAFETEMKFTGQIAIKSTSLQLNLKEPSQVNIASI